MSSSSRLVELANAILRDATTVTQDLSLRNLAPLSFDIDAPSRVAVQEPDAIQALESLLVATRELHHLALGPVGSLISIASFEDPLALSVVSRFKIAQHVPVHGQASYKDLSEVTGIPLADLKPILRMAMTSYIFTEPAPGMVAHTAASRLLSENAFARSVTAVRCDEHFAGSARVADALSQHPGSEEPSLSGWGLANNASKPLFVELAEKHPERAATFFQGMTAMGATVNPGTVFDGFDWAAAAAGKAQIVDIGGGKGPVSIALARRYPDLSFIVEDFEDEVTQGKEEVPEDVKGRVTFKTHDLFSPQPVKNADIYFYRAVFHNWPDKYCIRLLESLLPALKKGARVRIHDPMTPEKGKLDFWKERQKIAMDIRMFCLFNSHDREAEQWKDIFAKVDPRFRIVDMKPSDSSARAMLSIEAVWDE